jgi:hypothetical protein
MMPEVEKIEEEFVNNSLPEVDDNAETDNTIAPVRYDITSYGADYDVEGIVRRLQRGDIWIPEFQRSYVWKLPEASRFIESLLLGLPVPGIFLARETGTNSFLVIDGQQRLKTLLFFYEGYFNPKPEEKTRRIFTLTSVQKPFEGKTYQTLDERDRLRLDNSIIHATIVRQEAPPDEDTSMYHIFERLNSAGRVLTAQEMRCAIYHGALIEEIKSLNEYPNWRAIFGKESPRLKDQELILRFLALYHNADRYQRPMAEFLNKFASEYRGAGPVFLQECRSLFVETIELIWEGIERKAFRLGRALNAAVFDSVMVGLARRIRNHPGVDPKQFARVYEALLADPKYVQAVSRSTADEAFVSQRLDKATEYFAKL